MFIQTAIATISLLTISCASLASNHPQTALQTAQQSCLKVAKQSGQDKISPLGVRRVCALDVAQPAIGPDSVALPGPTGVVGQPELEDEATACTDQSGTVVPGCWIR